MTQLTVGSKDVAEVATRLYAPPRTRSSQDKRRRVLILVMLGIPTAYMLFFLGVPTGRAVYTS
ncbi:MAG: hypothetical protein M0005_11150, partial [Actinomycetota bacterium]|nr:hypothetical protein [Actinomycetota bacterium]